ncbi:TolC family protein [Rhodoferax sp.]|uniref:TolC family protein n=1 Tax=Rhodoferax sp. TaxID=50421 RepID=UPI002767248F|nr:TolC family protein [Rhodoferax sp.]
MPSPPYLRRFIPLVLAIAVAQTAAADVALPDPLRLVDVAAIAVDGRAEVAAAKARAEALAQRPAIVSAPEDPMVSASIDHYPYRAPEMEGGIRYSRSVTIEQKFPLSRVRTHRRDAALADAKRARALADATGLDMVQDAQRNFLMLHERRRMRIVIDEQIALAQQLVGAAASRYASGAGVQADVLRAEVELARLKAEQQVQTAQSRAAETMLNVSLGRPAQSVIPALSYQPNREEPASQAVVLERAASNRPELGVGTAEVDRAKAEVEVMRTMYKPMAMVRIGQARTMADGAGAMVMIGISVPIWRERLDAGVSEARAMQRMADADLESMRRMVSGEVLAAREKVNASRTQLVALESEVLPRALVATDSALAAYASGKGSLVAVIESARALWGIQAELVMAETAIGDAWARLDRAMGTRQETKP